MDPAYCGTSSNYSQPLYDYEANSSTHGTNTETPIKAEQEEQLYYGQQSNSEYYTSNYQEYAYDGLGLQVKWLLLYILVTKRNSAMGITFRIRLVLPNLPHLRCNSQVSLRLAMFQMSPWQIHHQLRKAEEGERNRPDRHPRLSSRREE